MFVTQSALIFEKLRSKFSARCSGFLFNNGKAEHEYYFALIVCIPVNSRKYSTAILNDELFSLLFRSSAEILLPSYSFTSLFKMGLMYLYMCCSMNIEIWSNEFQYVSFNVFIVSLSSWQVSFGEGAKGNVRGFLNNFMKFKKCKLINSKILEPLSWKYRGKDGGYLRKYKVFNVYRPKISSWQHEKSKF